MSALGKVKESESLTHMQKIDTQSLFRKIIEVLGNGGTQRTGSHSLTELSRKVKEVLVTW